MLLELTCVAWVVVGLFLAFVTRTWVFLALLALVECVWVGLIAALGLEALFLNELTWLFWASVFFFFSAVELVLALTTFLTLHQGGASFWWLS